MIKFKKFHGRINEEMPKLIKEGRTPLSVADVMKKDYQLKEYIDTGDAVFYHPNGNIKIVLDAEPMHKITPDSKLRGGLLVLAEGLYEKLEGKEFTRDEVKDITGRLLSKKEAKSNPILKYLARDQALLDDYVDTECKHSKGIRIAHMPLPQDVVTGTLWCVSRYGSFGANSSNYLNLDFGHIIGVLPEVKSK